MSKKKVIAGDPFDDIKAYAKRKNVFITLDDLQTDLDIDTPYSYDNKSKILNVNTINLVERSKIKTLELIRFFHEYNGLIFKKNTKEVFRNYQGYHEKKPDKKLLRFFEPIIPREDFQALKASLFLRYQSNHGAKISHLKQDIIERFGKRGNNIANLCSVDYFEDELKPFYNIAPPKEFKAFYEAIVGEGAKALFVSKNHNSIESLKVSFLETLEKAKKHHMPLFKIFAKGDSNVDLLKKLVSKIDSDSKFNEDIPLEEFTIQKQGEDSMTISYQVDLQFED